LTLTAEPRTELDRTRFYIDGQWVEPRGAQTHRAVEAATGDLLSFLVGEQAGFVSGR
jgi:betaine-aldehyde dehydrogenase